MAAEAGALTARANSEMNCPKCGKPIEASGETHKCAYVMKLQSGVYGISGGVVGTVVEGRPDTTEGRRVDSRPPSGGRAFSRTDEKGSFAVELSGVLDKGRANERQVLQVLVEALSADGRTATLVSGSQDNRGEDGLLMIDGVSVAVQIVSVPVEPTVWKELSAKGGLEASGTIDDAAAMIRRALEHKRGKATDTILVLDATHFGAFVGPRLVQAYCERHGDPEQEFALTEVWLVGPTSRSAFRLASQEHGPAV